MRVGCCTTHVSPCPASRNDWRGKRSSTPPELKVCPTPQARVPDCGVDSNTSRCANAANYCLVLFLFVSILPGCSLLPRRAAVPPSLTSKAVAIQSPGLRYWPNINLELLFKVAADSNDRERRALALSGTQFLSLPAARFLVISGGGDDGAFGAGLLVGWTKRGDRPAFKVVTGVSAGALIAPFAFLGPAYDEVLHDVAVSIGPNDVFHPRNLLNALLSDAFADDAPLAAMIDRYVTSNVVAAVAEEYRKGRVLLISTTDLDSRQPVVWNMGAIAASGSPGALKLFKQVMLASASIPGIFSPVMIDVTVDGKPFQEMHVDGGVMTQAFLFPPHFIKGILSKGISNRPQRILYVIRNGRVAPTWQSVARRSTSVGHRALDALIDAQGINDLYRLEVIARDEGEDFNVAYIGDEFDFPRHKMFDSAYLHQLFMYSYRLASEGSPWRQSLPSEVRPAGSDDPSLP
jgi:hypothetical protein